MLSQLMTLFTTPVIYLTFSEAALSFQAQELRGYKRPARGV
jgi:hypothetical protein